MLKAEGGNQDADTHHGQGMIFTHSSFEKIPVSMETRKAYIEAELAELREAIDQSERGQGLSVKRLEAKLAIREQLLERLMDKERKDDGVTFEMAGLDHCAVDEAHYFKNKSIPERGLDRKA